MDAIVQYIQHYRYKLHQVLVLQLNSSFLITGEKSSRDHLLQFNGTAIQIVRAVRPVDVTANMQHAGWLVSGVAVAGCSQNLQVRFSISELRTFHQLQTTAYC